jgi:hypothetical protein
MRIRFCVCLFCLVLFLAIKPGGTGIPASHGQTGKRVLLPASDACSLIDSSEIAAVQGAPVQLTQPTGYDYGNLKISQCYYTAISGDGKNLSVHLQVIQPSSDNAKRDAVSEFWKARFNRGEKKNESKEKRAGASEEEEEDAPGIPIRISGIGDEAVWLASTRGGALFVRSKDKLVRVTLGGSADPKTQIEKSRTLAKRALARLK